MFCLNQFCSTSQAHPAQQRKPDVPGKMVLDFTHPRHLDTVARVPNVSALTVACGLGCPRNDFASRQRRLLCRSTKRGTWSGPSIELARPRRPTRGGTHQSAVWRWMVRVTRHDTRVVLSMKPDSVDFLESPLSDRARDVQSLRQCMISRPLGSCSGSQRVHAVIIARTPGSIAAGSLTGSLVAWRRICLRGKEAATTRVSFQSALPKSHCGWVIIRFLAASPRAWAHEGSQSRSPGCLPCATGYQSDTVQGASSGTTIWGCVLRR